MFSSRRSRRLVATMLVASLALTGFVVLPAIADDVPDDDMPEQPVAVPPAPRPQPPPPPPPRPQVLPQARPEPPRPQPEVRMRTFRPQGFYLAPELLGMRFHDSDVEHATLSSSGDTAEIDAEFTAGGRLGLGWAWGNGWDVIVRGTLVPGSYEASARPGAGGTVDTTFGDFDTADATLDVDYLVVDLEGGYTMGSLSSHHVRAFFGLRAASIEQDFAALFDPDVAAAGDRHFVRQLIETDGWGARAGLDGHVAITRRWSWFLEGAVSAIGVTTDISTRRTSSEGAVVAVNTLTSDDDTAVVVEGRSGFAWLTEVFDDGMFGIRFGWELSEWNDVPTADDIAADSVPDPDRDEFRADGGFVRAEWIF